MRRTSSVGVSASTEVFVLCPPHVSMRLCMHSLVNAQRHVAVCCLCVMFHVSFFSSWTQEEMESLTRFKWVNFIIHIVDLFFFSMCRASQLLQHSQAEVLPFQCMHRWKIHEGAQRCLLDCGSRPHWAVAVLRDGTTVPVWWFSRWQHILPISVQQWHSPEWSLSN